MMETFRDDDGQIQTFRRFDILIPVGLNGDPQPDTLFVVTYVDDVTGEISVVEWENGIPIRNRSRMTRSEIIDFMLKNRLKKWDAPRS